MIEKRIRPTLRGAGWAFLLLSLTLGGCGGGSTTLKPRSIVNFTGARIQADPEAMAQVELWLRPQLEDIERNPSFLIRMLRENQPLYPWSRLRMLADTAQLALENNVQDAETPFLVYAHLRLMATREELERWLPGSDGLEGLALERAMQDRVADLWLLGRSVFDTQAHGPLDEMLYAREAGFLEEFILLTQPRRFETERATYFAERPDREAAFREWFQRVFEADGPRYVASVDEGSPTETPGEPPLTGG
jgi:hypothetical protein